MLVLRIPFALNIPVLDGANDVGLVRRAKLNLNLVAPASLDILHEEVQPSGPRVEALAILQNKITKAEQ